MVRPAANLRVHVCKYSYVRVFFHETLHSFALCVTLGLIAQCCEVPSIISVHYARTKDSTFSPPSPLRMYLRSAQVSFYVSYVRHLVYSNPSNLPKSSVPGVHVISLQVVAPKRAALAVAEAEYGRVLSGLHAKQSELRALEAKLAGLEAKLEESQKRKAKLEVRRGSGCVYVCVLMNREVWEGTWTVGQLGRETNSDLALGVRMHSPRRVLNSFRPISWSQSSVPVWGWASP